MIYTGQVVEIVLETNTDLSGATSPEIRYEKPNGFLGVWTAALSGNNLTYTTTNNDLNVAGTWKLQAYVNQSGTRLGNIVRIEVEKRL